MGAAHKRIVARPGRDKLYHHRLAFVAQRGGGDDQRIVFRKDAVVVQTVLGERLQPAGIGEHPIVAGADDLARMVEREANPRAGRAGQGVGHEVQEVTVRRDVQIDGLRFRLGLAAASREKREHDEKQLAARKRLTPGVCDLHGIAFARILV